MNPFEAASDRRLDALFAHARPLRPDTSLVEYAFETRLLARLRAERETGASLWAMAAWRLAPIFAAVVLGLAVWQTEFSEDANDAEALARLDNPVNVDLWDNAN